MKIKLQLVFLLIVLSTFTHTVSAQKVDTLLYPYLKELQLSSSDSFFTDAMVGNVRTASQAYHNNQEIEILGVQFWGAAYSVSPASQTLAVTVSLFEVDASNMPTNELATAQLTITQEYQFYEVNFATPYLYNKNFAVAVRCTPNDTLAVITNNADNLWTQNYGEGLAWRKFGSGTWNASKNFFGQDLEYMIFPIVRYTPSVNFTASETSTCAGSKITFTNSSSSIFSNKMFNINAFNKHWGLAQEDSTFKWNYDGSVGTSKSKDGSHTYNSAGEFQAHLIGEMQGYYYSSSDTLKKEISVKKLYNENISKSLCDGDSFSFGTQTLTKAGTYTEAFQSISGCDSTVTLTLSISPVYNEIASKAICAGSSYTFGTQTLISAGTFTEVFQSSSGCDSTVVLTLTVNPMYNETASKAICSGDSYLFGTQILTSAGTFKEVFQSINGCDSTVTLTLSINPIYDETASKAICPGSSYLFGKQTLTTAGTYTETFSSMIGCDSTVTLTLTVNPKYNETASKSICAGNFYVFGTQTLTDDGTYTETFKSMSGCDSTVVLTLAVNSVDTTVTINGTTLTANVSNATYMWINCDNGNTPIEGETNQSFTAKTSGNYAVIITHDLCSVISACTSVVLTRIDDFKIETSITAYPNPTNGTIVIDTDKIIVDEITVSNAVGKVVKRIKPNSPISLVELNEKGSLYLINVRYKRSSQVIKVVKQ